MWSMEGKETEKAEKAKDRKTEELTAKSVVKWRGIQK